jgi:hypothetical protein
VKLDITCAILLISASSSARLDTHPPFKPIHVLGIAPKQFALLFQAMDKVVCACRLRILAREVKLRNESVEDGCCGGVCEETR